MKKRIYLASPYSHPKPYIRSLRFDAVTEAAAHLIRQGDLVFSPIAHSHPIAQYGLAETPFEFWREMDLSFLETWATNLYVLTLDDWTQSAGVSAEIDFAKQLGLPVDFMCPDTFRISPINQQFC